MGKEIEYNRILNSIRESVSISELKSIGRWIDLFGSHYKDKAMTDKLKSKLSSVMDNTRIMEVTSNDISTLDILCTMARSDEDFHLIEKRYEDLRDRMYKSLSL